MDWKPIETAPKDGTPVLLAPHMMRASWDFGDKQWMLMTIPLDNAQRIAADWTAPAAMFFCLYASQFAEPTHWMPLPTPPAPTGRDGDREDG